MLKNKGLVDVEITLINISYVMLYVVLNTTTHHQCDSSHTKKASPHLVLQGCSRETLDLEISSISDF